MALTVVMGALAAAAAARVTFEGERVLDCAIDSAGKEQLVADLGLDVWAYLPGGRWHVQVDPRASQALAEGGVECSVYIGSVEQLVQKDEAVRVAAAAGAQSYHDEYHRFDEIVDYLRDLCGAHSALCEFTESIGTSAEGRAIPSMRLAGPGNNGTQTWFWTSQSHAREWISAAVVQFLLEDLLTGYGSDADATFILDTYEVIVVPVVNPDGYEYSWDTNRLWRKSRGTNAGSSCIGADLNRNAGTADTWGGAGASSNACADTYRGDAFLSEPETQAWFGLWQQYAARTVYAVDWHSYTQLLLRPPSQRGAPDHPNEAGMRALGDLMVPLIAQVDGMVYTSQTSLALYATTGTILDALVAETGTVFGQTIELRDLGQYGFVLPPDQIIPNALEIRAGIYAGARFMAQQQQEE